MKRHFKMFGSLMFLLCIGLLVVSCGKKEAQQEDIYSEKILLNGFDTVEDLYKVRQHTYIFVRIYQLSTSKGL